jgi:hypothetical protein
VAILNGEKREEREGSEGFKREGFPRPLRYWRVWGRVGSWARACGRVRGEVGDESDVRARVPERERELRGSWAGAGLASGQPSARFFFFFCSEPFSIFLFSVLLLENA